MRVGLLSSLALVPPDVYGILRSVCAPDVSRLSIPDTTHHMLSIYPFLYLGFAVDG
jgi:hypothetical protein